MHKRKRNDGDDDDGDDDEDYNGSSPKIKTEPSRKRKSSGSSGQDTFVNEEMSDCLLLLESIMKEEIAGPFLIPVDHIELNIPTYPEVIKQPMDLGTIKEMLLGNSLANPEHFAVHIRLVFSNALTFNIEESLVGQYAKKLQTIFETKFAEMVERWKVEVATGVSDQNQKELDQEREIEKIVLQKNVDTLFTQNENIKLQINELKRKRGQISHHKASLNSVVKRVRLTRPKAPLTIKQKEELCQKIGELGEEDFPGLINLVDPDANDDAEFTLNFAVLDDITILNIQKYVQDCAKAKKKKNGQKRKSTFK